MKCFTKFSLAILFILLLVGGVFIAGCTTCKLVHDILVAAHIQSVIVTPDSIKIYGFIDEEKSKKC